MVSIGDCGSPRPGSNPGRHPRFLSRVSMEKYTKKILPALSFIGVCILFFLLGRYGINLREIIAITVTFLGYVMWYIGRRHLGGSYSLIPQASELITDGLYSKIHHPIYVSQIFVLTGVLLFINSFYLWPLFFPVALLQWYRAKKEESLLRNVFGEKYLSYKKSLF